MKPVIRFHELIDSLQFKVSVKTVIDGVTRIGVIQMIERESGEYGHWNVRMLKEDGKSETFYVRTFPLSAG